MEPEILQNDEPLSTKIQHSIAISLKRIADCLEAPEPKQSANINHILWSISQVLEDWRGR